jgi:TRAP-type C4-dicarboxylate transport system permease small subunit
MLERWLAHFDRWLVNINIVLMGTMTTMVTVAVVLRYVFSISFAWSEEAISLIFVMSSLLGSVCVAYRNEHISVGFIYDWVPRERLPWVRIGVSVAVIVTMVVMINASLTWIDVSMTVPTPAMQLPFWWFYSALPFAFLMIAGVEAVKIVLILRARGEETRR